MKEKMISILERMNKMFTKKQLGIFTAVVCLLILALLFGTEGGRHIAELLSKLFVVVAVFGLGYFFYCTVTKTEFKVTPRGKHAKGAHRSETKE
ncbi:MAG: hypothetical protein IKI57_01445 [Clostridia bacterium]|nr:hypothetical protein [Clostridia bacterium]